MTDAKAREAIISEIDTNFFVEAGAGSGKTTILVERMVAMVEKDLDVSKICTITFTKAAANEFYERFQKRLIERSVVPEEFEGSNHELPKPTKETADRCQKALENIDLCFMGTIDSFCNMILSEHPTKGKIPSDARLINDEEEKEIYRQFYVSVRAGKYGEELKKKANHFDILFWNGEETFAKLIKEIMDRRNADFDFNKGSDLDPYMFVKDDRETLIKVLDRFNEDLSGLVPPKLGEKDTRDPMEVYIDASNTLHQGWHYNYTGVERALKTISTIQYQGTPDELGFTTERFVREKDGMTVLNIADEDVVDALIPKLKEYKYYKSMSLLTACVPYLEEEMREQGKFTFFDYLYYLRNMIQDDADNNEGKLIDYIYKRHSYFMIDEFQDTNPMQAEIFFHLAAEDPSVSNWKECKPRQGSLFIVGDPKQSIYRFRNADVSSYIEIRKLFENGVGKVVNLVNNFRSKNVMKNFFNEVFEQVMKEDTADQSQYKDIENVSSDEAQGEFEGMFAYETYSGQLLESHPGETDNEQLVKIIKRLVNNPSYQITERDRTKENYGSLRNITFKDFMIIFSSKNPIASCIDAFNKEEIPVKVEGKVLFEDCEALKTIASIYKAVTSNGDIISLIAALYTSVFGLNENDLTLYKSKGNSFKIDPDKEYSDSGIESALSKLADTARQIPALTPSSLFEKIIDDYRIYEYVSSNGMEVVYYTLELIRGEEQNGNIITYEDASKFMDDLLSGESGLERCLSLKEEDDAVHIANLHKVKGLERPIVILAKAGSPKNDPGIRIDNSYTNDEGHASSKGYLINISETASSKISYTIIETDQYQQQAEAEKESLKKENDRLVYVAATRARNALIVNKARQKGGKAAEQDGQNKWKVLKDQISKNGKKKLDRKEYEFFEMVEENFNYKNPEHETVDPKDLYKTSTVTNIEDKPSYSKASPSTLTMPSKLNAEPIEKESEEKVEGETYSTMMGTMVHRMMEMIIMSKDKLQKNVMINNIISEYLTSEFENRKELFADAMNNVYDVMHNGGFPQINGAMQEILPEVLNADEVYSEVPFTYKEEETIWNGIIDLIYKKDGKLHIIDWKTNRSDKGLAEHYKNQLDTYKEATKQIIGEDVEDALIYHINY